MLPLIVCYIRRESSSNRNYSRTNSDYVSINDHRKTTNYESTVHLHGSSIHIIPSGNNTPMKDSSFDMNNIIIINDNDFDERDMTYSTPLDTKYDTLNNNEYTNTGNNTTDITRNTDDITKAQMTIYEYIKTNEMKTSQSISNNNH